MFLSCVPSMSCPGCIRDTAARPLTEPVKNKYSPQGRWGFQSAGLSLDVSAVYTGVFHLWKPGFVHWRGTLLLTHIIPECFLKQILHPKIICSINFKCKLSTFYLSFQLESRVSRGHGSHGLTPSWRDSHTHTHAGQVRWQHTWNAGSSLTRANHHELPLLQ